MWQGSEETGGKPTQVGNIAGDKLRSYIERIERLEEDKAGIASDVRDVFAEAKANGFCTKTMRRILKLRGMKETERTEQAYMLDLYTRALGMQLELDLSNDERAARMIEDHKVVEIAKKIHEVLLYIVYEKSGVWVPRTPADKKLAKKLAEMGFIMDTPAATGTYVITDEGKVEALKAKAAA